MIIAYIISTPYGFVNLVSGLSLPQLFLTHNITLLFMSISYFFEIVQEDRIFINSLHIRIIASRPTSGSDDTDDQRVV